MHPENDITALTALIQRTVHEPGNLQGFDMSAWLTGS